MSLRRAFWIVVVVGAVVVALWLVSFVILGSGGESGPTISQVSR